MVKFGAGTYCAEPLRVLFEQSNLIVGKFCSISHGVTIVAGGEHNSNFITTYPFNMMNCGYSPDDFPHPKTKGEIKIYHDVWIGMNAIILSGVTIGSGAVIGAGAVVSKDVEPYSVVVGNPAQHIKYRFEKEVIEFLLKVEWWNWEKVEIIKAVPLLMSDKIEEFIEYCKSEGKV